MAVVMTSSISQCSRFLFWEFHCCFVKNVVCLFFIVDDFFIIFSLTIAFEWAPRQSSWALLLIYGMITEHFCGFWLNAAKANTMTDTPVMQQQRKIYQRKNTATNTTTNTTENVTIKSLLPPLAIPCLLPPPSETANL